MAGTLSKGTLFPEKIVTDIISKVRGKSSLSALCQSEPIPFNGAREFTFNFDKEVDLVAESGAKSNGGVTLDAVTILPVKIEYGARVSDEFLIASEEAQIDILSSFSEGFAKKAARGFDLMAMHGINPRTGLEATQVIGDNCFDKKVIQTVQRAEATPDADVESAIALIDAQERDVTGLIMAPAFRSALASMVDKDGRKIFPELAWGGAPGALNGLPVQVNSTVSANDVEDVAILGDFENSFRWGYAKEMPIEIIKYGNPDNDAVAGDLKGHNQIYIRAEAYLGWGILDPSAFARILKAAD